MMRALAADPDADVNQRCEAGRRLLDTADRQLGIDALLAIARGFDSAAAAGSRRDDDALVDTATALALVGETRAAAELLGRLAAEGFDCHGRTLKLLGRLDPARCPRRSGPAVGRSRARRRQEPRTADAQGHRTQGTGTSAHLLSRPGW